MENDFLTWFLYKFMDSFVKQIKDICAVAFAIILAVVTFPIWILPFVYWWFFVRKDANEHDGE